jgi:acetolactate synthase I/II/III large subunit
MIKVSDYIVRRLHELGCGHVFMVTGGAAMHLNESFACSSSPYRVLFCHHEQACAIAAEGLYRAAGKIGVVNVTSGPGGLNTLTGVMGQWTDSLPAIYISGQVKQGTTLGCCRNVPLRQLGDQEVDIVAVVSHLTKYAVCIKDPRTVRYEVEKAFYLANEGRMGPVWLDIPMDVQAAMVDEASLLAFSLPSEALAVCDVDGVVELLRASRRPVIVVGHGVRLARQIETLQRLLDTLFIPALATFGGFDLLANDHPCYAGRIGTLGTRGGNFTLQNADLVLFLGTRNNVRQVSYNWGNFAHRARTIVVDIDSAELRKPTFCPTYAVHSDLADFLPRLQSALASQAALGDYSGWLCWAKQRTARYPAVRPEHRMVSDRIHPYPFFDQFTRHLPGDAVVVAGNGTASVVLFQAGVVRPGQRYVCNSGCASMGYDLPAAIGAALGAGRDVWCLAGDGSLQMNLQELATLSHNRLPVKLLVLDNGGYASIRQTQMHFFGVQHGCGNMSGLGFPNLERLAAAYDLPYLCSTRLDEVEVHQSKVSAIAGPVLWEVRLRLDYSFEPKVSSMRLSDGSMVSKSLEDMAPFLEREEFLDNMLEPADDP